MKIYRLSTARLITYCGIDVLLFPLIGIVALCVLSIWKGSEGGMQKIQELDIWIFPVLFFFFLFPGISYLIAYWNHYLFDRDTTLEIDHRNRKVAYRNGLEFCEIDMDEIFCVRDLSKDVGRFVTIYYYEIVLKNSTTVITLTRLLVSDLEKQLKGIPFRRRRAETLFLRRSMIGSSGSPDIY